MERARRSGILLHPTSLPGAGGIGSLGPAAHRFLEQMQRAGQSVWQVLPLGPTGYGDSPYQSFSAFGGNMLLISPERLAEDGLVDAADVDALPPGDADRVSFGRVIPARQELLTKAYRAFAEGKGTEELRTAFPEFRTRESPWLDDFTLFGAIHDTERKAWVEWPAALAAREPDALEEARGRHREDMDRLAFVQFLFFRQWDAVRAKARELGIEILGDVPLFVAHDSCDVWVHRQLFDLQDDGSPRVLAGAPPDMFTDDGQLWGNPLYDWDRLREQEFAWWVARMRGALRLYDSVRLDHFRGFVGCWATPAGEKTARNGEWVPVPGQELFDCLRGQLEAMPFVAEDLGDITPEVHELRDRYGFPGMKILQFGFAGDPRTNEFAPHNYSRNSVVYTGTHDNETIRGWWSDGRGAHGRAEEEVAEESARIAALIGTDAEDAHWGFLRIALSSIADTAIVPIQDVLGLGNEARMNTPSRAEGNWGWRMREDAFTDELIARLRDLTAATGRWPEGVSRPENGTP